MFSLIKFRKCRSFGLIEALVSMVILSVGLLGSALIQIHTLKMNKIALENYTAQVLAEDMINRIRANRVEAVKMTSGVLDNNFARTGTGSKDFLMTVDPAPSPSCSGTQTTPDQNANKACSSAELANYELWEWQQQVAASLPGGRGTTCGTINTTGSLANVQNYTTSPALSHLPSCSTSGTKLIVVVWWNRTALDGSVAIDPGSNTQFFTVSKRVE